MRTKKIIILSFFLLILVVPFFVRAASGACGKDGAIKLSVYIPGMTAEGEGQYKGCYYLKKFSLTNPGTKEPGSLPDYIAGVYSFGLQVGGFIALLMIMIGGLQWVFAGGSPEKISKSKERMINAIVGFLLLLVSYTILNTINPDLTRLKPLRLDRTSGGDCSWSIRTMNPEMYEKAADPNRCGTQPTVQGVQCYCTKLPGGNITTTAGTAFGDVMPALQEVAEARKKLNEATQGSQNPERDQLTVLLNQLNGNTITTTDQNGRVVATENVPSTINSKDDLGNFITTSLVAYSGLDDLREKIQNAPRGSAEETKLKKQYNELVPIYNNVIYAIRNKQNALCQGFFGRDTTSLPCQPNAGYMHYEDKL